MFCQNCLKKFDDLRKKIVLDKCGHMICSLCLYDLQGEEKNSFLCPVDDVYYGKGFQQLKNWCQEHQMDFEIFCNFCQIQCCSDCVIFGMHKNHQYWKIEQKNGDFEFKVKEVEWKLENVQKQLKQFCQKIVLKYRENLKKDQKMDFQCKIIDWSKYIKINLEQKIEESLLFNTKINIEESILPQKRLFIKTPQKSKKSLLSANKKINFDHIKRNRTQIKQRNFNKIDFNQSFQLKRKSLLNRNKSNIKKNNRTLVILPQNKENSQKMNQNRILDLSDRKISSKNINRFIHFMRSQKIKVLKLNNNQINDHCLKFILKRIKNLKIEKLEIQNNLLKSPTIDYLFSFNKYNKHLKQIFLNKNSINFTNSKIFQKTKILLKNELEIFYQFNSLKINQSTIKHL